MLFWSKTKKIVHDFTEKRDCFLTLEDTLVGFIMNGLTWCGKEESNGKAQMDLHTTSLYIFIHYIFYLTFI